MSLVAAAGVATRSRAGVGRCRGQRRRVRACMPENDIDVADPGRGNRPSLSTGLRSTVHKVAVHLAFATANGQACEEELTVAKDQNRSILYSIGPQLGPNRRQSNSRLVVNSSKRCGKPPFLRDSPSSGQKWKLPSARSLGHDATRSTRHTRETPNFHL